MKQAKKRTFIKRTCLVLIIALGFFVTTLTYTHKNARAGVDNFCLFCGGATLCCITPGLVMQTQNMMELEVWYRMFYQSTIRPALTDMASQWSDTIMMQARMIGGFFDAQNHSAAQLSLQRLQAQAMRDYTPGESLCRYGTLSRSLGASDAIARRTKIGIAERSQNRQLANFNSNAANATARERRVGRASDKRGRIDQFQRTFCDRTDSSSALASVCGTTMTSNDLKRDIDYVRSFADPLTLQMNFAGGTNPADQRNTLALANNLYAHNIISDAPNRDALDPSRKTNQASAFLDYRSVVAKRSVAENTFASIAALKAPGTNSSNIYMRAIMTELGMPTADIDRLMGANNPSYYAQMEILSKRLYQNPGFYAELMETPANVVRQQAAMRSISLMQQRDVFESLQRSEMLLSVLLELQALTEQARLEDKRVK